MIKGPVPSQGAPTIFTMINPMFRYRLYAPKVHLGYQKPFKKSDFMRGDSGIASTSSPLGEAKFGWKTSKPMYSIITYDSGGDPLSRRSRVVPTGCSEYLIRDEGYQWILKKISTGHPTPLNMNQWLFDWQGYPQCIREFYHWIEQGSQKTSIRHTLFTYAG